MQGIFFEKLKNYFVGMLIITAFLFPAGCAAETEEHGLTEMAAAGEPSDADPGSGAADGDGTDLKEDGAGETEGKNRARICVYVCGAVCEPGIYELEEGARVYEAVELAGGMTEEASEASVNLAREAEDGGQIYIPTLEEAASQGVVPGAEGASADVPRKVNINTASAEELMTLTGIGEAKAKSIMRYREENGGFQSTEELMEISGIKEGVFEKIKDDITI